MLQFAALIALAAQVIAIPQGGPASPVPRTIPVTVGQGSPKFDPSAITNVSAGDTIVFTFTGPFQHSITQSNFTNPCTPLDGGFNSGLLGNDSQFSLTISDASKPIWFYCQQTTPTKHCGAGMVGSVNAPTTGNTFDAFLAAAKSLGDNEPSQTPATVLTAAVATGTVGPAQGANPPAPTSPGNGTNNGGGGGNDGGAGMVKLSITSLALGFTAVVTLLTL